MVHLILRIIKQYVFNDNDENAVKNLGQIF